MPAYGSDAALIAYLAESGRVLPTGMTPAVARYWGSAYVNMWEDRYYSTAIALPDSFPRVEYDPVPVPVEYATYEAAFAYASGVDLFGAGGTAGGQVTEERVDVISVKYAAPTDGAAGYWDSNRFILPLAYALLLPYMRKANATSGAFVVSPSRNRCGC